jgi:hypothetical protein
MATIYLSSTYEDLKDFRLAVLQALHQSEYRVINMENYVATDDRPVDKCLKDVEQADIYVGVFAFRYGYIPPSDHNNPNRLSITELELRHAQCLKKPRLIFLADEKAAGFPPAMMDAMTGDGEAGQCIKRLRNELERELTKSSFSAPHHLASLVQAAVTSHLAHNPLPASNILEAPAPAAITWDIAKLGSPYPGLMHFTRKYASVFFGRDLEVGEILDRMREPEGRFLFIGGASGSGKSWLVDAGVFPRIKQHGIGGKTYTCVRMLPSEGNHPFDALLRPLHAYTERAGMKPYQLAEHLTKQPADLSRHLKDLVMKGLDTDGLVLFIDQMEELFTVRDRTQATAFLAALYQAAQDAGVHVMATIRSDFLQQCHEHPDLLKVLNGRGYYALAPPDGRSLHDMIARPAHCAGLTISEGLVRRLVDEVEQERGSFPLLAFALQQLFDQRVGNELTERAFDHMGGLTGAIRTHVASVEQKICEAIGTDDGQVFAKLFAPLVVVTMERTPTRRRAAKEHFDRTIHSVIDILIKERLLTAEGTNEQSLIAVAHEKLFEGWPRLAGWIEDNREQLFILRQAEIEAGEWIRHGNDLNYLWAEERLKKLQGILQDASHGQHVNGAVRLYAAPQDKLIARLEDASLSHKDRLKIGLYLAALGDPRPCVGLTRDWLPDIQWIEIPKGEVKLEKVHHVFTVKPFRMARYPVTNAQFDAFLNAQDGYDNGEWWKDIEQSHGREQSRWQEANCPRETVYWYDAIAFCRWLSAKTRTSLRLPTEWEWQQAATGGDPHRQYPWEGGWDAGRSNSSESRLDRTTSVGMYPLGATRQGVLDMAGNVMEWCLNRYEEPDQPEAVSINKTGGGRVLRGGAWNFRPMNLRVSLRNRFDPGNRNKYVGFRLAQDIEP